MLPQASRAIDGTHFSISKIDGVLWENYFYQKKLGYNVVCEAIVDDQKQITNIFVGFPGSVNDSRVLKRSTIYYFAQSQELFNANKG